MHCPTAPQATAPCRSLDCGSRRPPPLAGFTLLEVLFVVAILAVIAMIAVPDPAAGELYDLELATTQVTETLRQARQAAQRQGRTMELEVTAPAAVRVHRWDDTAAPPVRDDLLPGPLTRQPLQIDLASTPSTRRVTLAAAFQFDALGNRDSLFFGADGVPRYVDAAGVRYRLLDASLVLTHGADTRTVRVDPLTARITVQ